MYSQCDVVIDAGEDQVLCQNETNPLITPGTEFMLNGTIIGGRVPEFVWSSTGFVGTQIDDPRSLTPIGRITETETFYLTVSDIDGTNLIFDGDFESGTEDNFFTGYEIAAIPDDLINPGFLDVIPGIPPNPEFCLTCDHTFGDPPGACTQGNFLAVNGSTDQNTPVWCQTITIAEDTDYRVSYWSANLDEVPADPPEPEASLRMIIDADRDRTPPFIRVGGTNTVPFDECGVWNLYSVDWESDGIGGLVDICIVETNLALNGNDFGIDDIEMFRLCEDVIDSVTITIEEPPVINFDTLVCVGDFIDIDGNPYGPGFHTELLNDNNSLCDTLAEFFVEAIPPLTVFIDATANRITCFDSTITLTATWNPPIDESLIRFDWSTIGGNIRGARDTSFIVIDAGGQYELEIEVNDGQSLRCPAFPPPRLLIEEDLEPPVASAGADKALGCGTDSLRLDGTGSSMGGDFIVRWTTDDGNIVRDSSTYTPLIDAAGTYIIEVIDDDNGCNAFDTVVITVDNTLPEVVLDPLTEFDCSADEFILDATGSSVGDRYVYSWTTRDGGTIIPPSDTLLVSIGSPGWYILTITDTINTCVDSDSILVQGNDDPPILEVGPDLTLTCDSTSYTLRGRYTDAGDNPIVSWSTSDGNISSTINDSTIVIDQPGIYVFSVENSITRCSAEDTVVVSLDRQGPAASAGADRILNCDSLQVTLDGSGSSQGARFDPLWTTMTGNIVGPANQYIIQANRSGAYVLSIRDNINGCITRDTLNVTSDDDVPEIFLADSLQFDCSQTEFVLDATGSSTGPQFTYLWTTSNGTLIPPVNQLTVTVSTPGRYFLSISNSFNNCERIDSIEVFGDVDPPIVNAGPDRTLTCDSTSYTLRGSSTNNGGSPINAWRTEGGSIASTVNDSTIIIDAPGLYIFRVENSNTNCAAVDTVIISQDITDPTANGGPDRQLDCDSTAVTLSGAGSSTGNNITYLWTTTSGNILSGSTTLNPRVNSNGTYTLTVRNTTNGCTATDDVDVTTSSDFPNISIVRPADTINCENAIVTLDGSGSSGGTDFDPNWSTADGNIVTNPNNLNVDVDRAGTYVLTVTNRNSGCSNTAEINVVEFTDEPTANAGTSDEVTCRDTVLTLNGSGSSTGINFTYLWTAAPGNILSGNTTLNPEIDAAGTYTLTVTDNVSKCTSSAQVVITDNTQDPTANAGLPDTLDCLITELNLDGSGSSQGGNFQYAWTTTDGNILSGGNTLSPRVNGVGLYVLTVTDNINGCTATSTVRVEESGDRPTADAGQERTITCRNSTVFLDGSRSSTGADFTYLWTTSDGVIVNGGTTLSPEVSSRGTYVLTVTDCRNNCTSVASVMVDTDFEQPDVNINTPDQITCTMRTVTLDGTGSDSGPGFSILWTTADGNILSGGTTLNPVVDQIGTYQILVTNQMNGCQDSVSVVVTQDESIPLSSINTPDSLTCSNPEITLDASGSTSGSSIRYNWQATDGGVITGPLDAVVTTVNAVGTYTLTVTDDDTGCTSQDIVMVGEDVDAPVVSAGNDFDIFCGQQNITITSQVLSSDGSVILRWSTIDGEIIGSTNGATITIGKEGTYIVEAEHVDNGCIGMDEVVVNLIDILDADLDITQPNCANPLALVDIAATSMGTPPYQYSLNDGNSFREFPINFFEPDRTYPVLIRDALGCTKRDTAVIGSVDTVSATITRSPEGLISPGTPVNLSVVTDRPFGDLDTIIWSEFNRPGPPRYLDFPFIQNPTARPDSSVTYVVYVETFDECVDTSVVRILVQQPPAYYAPTIFTPNNDNINERWTIYALDRVEIIEELQVFDRWGTMLYSDQNIPPGDESRGWDGRLNGEPVQQGVYVFWARLVLDNDIVVVSGSITVIY